MPINYITLSRQQLYDMVWSKPMSSLAKEFGLTDSGLAKRCRAVDVPIPYRGYWARKAAGQKPSQTPLPKYRRSAVANDSDNKPQRPTAPAPKPIERDGPEPTYHFEARAPLTEKPITALPPEQQALAARLEASPPKVRADLRGAHAAIRRTAVHLNAQKVKDFDWKTGERAGPIVRVTVDPPSIHRALRIADAVLRAAEDLGWSFQAPPRERDPYRPRYRDDEYQGPVWGLIMVDGEPLQVTVTERQRQVPHKLTDSEKRDRARDQGFRTRPWDLAPTGNLRVNLADTDGRVFKTIADRAKHRLDDHLPDVLHAILDHALAQKRWREQRRREEQVQREREHLEHLASQRREAHSKLIAELERQAGAWYRARLLRRYVLAARRQLGTHRIAVNLQGQSVDFFDWASEYVDQLDPLSPAPRHPDQTPRRAPYNSDKEALQNTLLRLLHHDGYVPRKVALEASGGLPPEGDDTSVDEEIEDDD